MPVDAASKLPTLKLGSRGPAVRAAKQAFHRWNAKPGNTTALFGVYFRTQVKAFQKAFGIPQTGVIGPATWKQLIPYLDDAGRQALGIRPAVPDLGPVIVGGKSVLDHDCTHATSGIPLYPAFDDGFAEGVAVIAPETLTVTRASSSRPGEAFYADGASGLRYWFGHLDRQPKVGVRIVKGAQLGRTCRNTIGGGPHVHVGVNVERLWGDGRQLVHRTDYRHGAPTIGAQLAAWNDL